MTITNTGSEADKLVGAKSMIAEAGGTHTHVRDGSVVNMVPVGAIDIPAGHTVTLQPGGMHVMFYGLKKPLEEGGQYLLALRFANAGEATLPVEVLKSTAMIYSGGPAVMGPGMAGAPMMGTSMSGPQGGSPMRDASTADPRPSKP
jgi:copper(I)-binding protein